MSLGKAFGWIIVALVAVLMVVNAFVMLVSPRAWFRMPGWLRAQGTLTEDRYGRGWGAVQLRLGGALILGSIGWVIYQVSR
jgi:hypothetical protein